MKKRKKAPSPEEQVAIAKIASKRAEEVRFDTRIATDDSENYLAVNDTEIAALKAVGWAPGTPVSVIVRLK